MSRKKILLVATVVKIHVNVFHTPCLKMFQELGWETWVCAGNDYDNPDDCVIPGCDHYLNIPFERNPLKPGNIKAYQMLRKIIRREHFELVYCHTPVGAMLARLAARSSRRNGTKVVYMAHGFHFFNGAPLLNWMIYYPVERFLSRFTDGLITINQEDYRRALKFHAGKVILIPGVGINLEKFQKKEPTRQDVRERLGISEERIVLMSVGELTKRKNHMVVIEAIAQLKTYDIVYIICGDGSMRTRLRKRAAELGIRDRLKLAGFRKDIAELHKAADIFVFPSLQEGLPVALMEAMASGLPIVASRIRGNEDLIQNNLGGYLVSARDPEQYAHVIEKAIRNSEKREQMKKRNLEIIENYEQEKVLHDMIKFFDEVVGGIC